MRRLSLLTSAVLTWLTAWVALAGAPASPVVSGPAKATATVPVEPAVGDDARRASQAELIQSAASIPLQKSSATPAATVLPVVAVQRQQVWMEVTAYCACARCCGPNASGITASGLPVTYNLGRFAAADSTVLPLGSHLRIPGYHEGRLVPVIDRGGAIKGNKLDVFFPAHDQALEWGRRWVLVTIESPAEHAL